MSKILSWICPVCGKEIRSIYERQLEQNKKAHLDKHESVVPKLNSEEKK